MTVYVAEVWTKPFSAKELLVYGVFLVAELSLILHVRGVLAGRCFYQLRQIRAIRNSPTVETSKLLVRVLINRRLDYCNSVLYSVRAMLLRKLQSVQNGATRVVERNRKYDPIITTLRDDLHWLPAVLRIRLKQRTLVYKSLHDTAPVYIAEMCIRRSLDTEHYHLRSAVCGELVMTLAKKVTLGRRSFRCAGPSL